ncbi:hypothetical protein [Nostocoides australiense]|nr:hypothetical protein [Tetrasphaera australiensis]HRW02248.1 hypothetical protein [Tetrasphaera sp.]
MGRLRQAAHAAGQLTKSGLRRPDSPTAPAPPIARRSAAETAAAGPAQTHDVASALADAMRIDGALAVALADSRSGEVLAADGDVDGMQLATAVAGNARVVRAKLDTLHDLGMDERIEDILITLDSQYHIIRTFAKRDGLFLYLVLDKPLANLAMARFKVATLERDLEL